MADPTSIAADKSLMADRGPAWHKRDRQAGRIPNGLHGVDSESTSGCVEYHGWLQGCSYEVVVTATPNGTVWPLLASVDTVSASERGTFEEKIGWLGRQVLYVRANSGSDNNQSGERIEWGEQGEAFSLFEEPVRAEEQKPAS